MDLVGSILSSMEKPPSISDKQKELIKRQKAELLKRQNAEKERINNFREKTTNHIQNFLNDPKRTRLKYPPLEHMYRAIVHEVTEEAGLIAHSFGQDGVDRYIMVFKKEFPPSDDELTVLRSGGEWNEKTEKEMAMKREREKLEAEEMSQNKSEDFVPNSNYKEKYQHLIGLDAAKDAARLTTTNKQYGFVPSENKKDHRSIEQTLADIKRKKQKVTHEPEGETA